jgi:hypothetical protein
VIARLEALDNPRLEAAEERLEETGVARHIAAEDPEKARRLGVGRPDLRMRDVAIFLPRS